MLRENWTEVFGISFDSLESLEYKETKKKQDAMKKKPDAKNKKGKGGDVVGEE